VGPRTCLGAVEKRKISAPAGNRTPVVQPLGTELPRLLNMEYGRITAHRFTVPPPELQLHAPLFEMLAGSSMGFACDAAIIFMGACILLVSIYVLL
jgi:hypothetical protein